MRILLAGNGLDLSFSDALSKTTMTEAALYGPQRMNDRGYPTIYPKAIRDFGKYDNSKREWDFSKKELDRIRSILLSENRDKTVETLYNQINEVLSPKSRKNLKDLFKKYIKFGSESIDPDKLTVDVEMINNDDKLEKVKMNFVAEKLSSYSIIFTTNYDFLIESLLDYGYNENNIDENDRFTHVIHLHGDLNGNMYVGNKEDNPIEATYFAQDIMAKELNPLWKEYTPDDSPHIEMDIYGGSANNEEDIIKLILEQTVKIIYDEPDAESGMIGKHKKEFDPTSFMILIKRLITINYYYFSESDKSEIEENRYFSHDEKGRVFKKINVPVWAEIKGKNSLISETIDGGFRNLLDDSYPKIINNRKVDFSSTDVHGNVTFYDSSFFFKDLIGHRIMFSKNYNRFFTLEEVEKEIKKSKEPQTGHTRYLGSKDGIDELNIIKDKLSKK